jgi:hypothetical protein
MTTRGTTLNRILTFKRQGFDYSGEVSTSNLLQPMLLKGMQGVFKILLHSSSSREDACKTSGLLYLRGALFRNRHMGSLALIVEIQSTVRGMLARSALLYGLHVSVPRWQAMDRGKVARARNSAVYSFSLKLQYLFRRRRRLLPSQDPVSSL